MWSTLQPLLGGALGGLIIALLNIGYGRWQANRSYKEERKGLLILLHSEMEYNHKTLHAFLDDSEETSSLSDLLSTGTWNDSKVRLAQLIDAEQLSKLDLFYRNIYLAAQIAGNDKTSSEDKLAYLKNIVESVEHAI